MSRPVGVLLVAGGAVVAVVAFGGIVATLARNLHGQPHSAAGSFIWFLVGVAAMAAGRHAIEESR